LAASAFAVIAMTTANVAGAVLIAPFYATVAARVAISALFYVINATPYAIDAPTFADIQTPPMVIPA